MKPNNNTIAAIKVCFFVLACFYFNGLMAQAIDFTNLTPDQRKATQLKIEETSRVDWRNTMNMLGLKTPTLVPQMEDTTKPANLHKKWWAAVIGLTSSAASLRGPCGATGRTILKAKPIIMC